MLTDKRQKYILEMLEEREVVSLQELVDLLSVSESTIRRDLSTLEELGELIRVHGGARKINKVDIEAAFSDKLDRFSHEKTEIARLAVKHINDGDYIFLDAGTTTLQMVDFLTEFKNITIVTNGIAHGQSLVNLGFSPILLGGVLRPSTQAIVGTTAIKQLSNYRFNKVFLGINSISLDHGLSTPSIEEANTKIQAMKQAEEVFVLADGSKFDKKSFHKISDLNGLTILSTRLDNNIIKKYQNEIRIEVYK